MANQNENPSDDGLVDFHTIVLYNKPIPRKHELILKSQ